MRPLRLQSSNDLYGIGDLAESMFFNEIVEARLTQAARYRWTTEKDTGTIDAETIFEAIDNGGRSVFLRKGNAIGYLHVYRRGRFRVDLDVAVPANRDDAKPLVDAVYEAFPRYEQKNEHSVSVRFWMLTKNGAHTMERDIAVPSFADVRANYTKGVSEQLAQMMSPDFEPGRGGQLLLWHGIPGTGKTYALRALAHAWNSWCKIDYVTDPEKFFGEASYLMPVLLSESEEDPEDVDTDKGKWRLLIFEDTGELLSADARAQTGQGLSRLLNVVDGFIGQGVKTLILITTNEEITKLHDAVQRPGRCAVSIKFDKLSASESAAWARANKVSIEAGPHSLAELFAIRDGNRSTRSETFGFRQPIAEIAS